MQQRDSIKSAIRSIPDLAEYYQACLTVGDTDLVQECLVRTPEWASFNDVAAALDDLGLAFTVSYCESRVPGRVDGRFWRRASDRRGTEATPRGGH